MTCLTKMFVIISVLYKKLSLSIYIKMYFENININIYLKNPPPPGIINKLLGVLKIKSLWGWWWLLEKMAYKI